MSVQTQPDAMQIARLAALECAMLAILRAAKEDGHQGVTVTAIESFDGSSIVDLTYITDGVGISGHSL